MRRTLVVIAVVGALGVLMLRLWPAPATPPAPPPAPPPKLIGIAGAAVDEGACAGPAIRELMKHPGWSFTLAERLSTDVVTGKPDDTLETVVIDATTGTWTDGDLPQSLELEPAERTAIMVAAAQSCVDIRKGNGYTSHYVVLSYGTVANDAIDLPGESRAAIDVIAVMARVRARYVAARRGVAEAMTFTIHGPRRIDTHEWETYAITVRPDGRVVGKDNEQIEHQLDPAEHVDLLDWAMQLPATVKGAHPLTGTLEIAGTRRPIALQLDTMVRVIESPSTWMNMFNNWWALNRERTDD